MWLGRGRQDATQICSQGAPSCACAASHRAGSEFHFRRCANEGRRPASQSRGVAPLGKSHSASHVVSGPRRHELVKTKNQAERTNKDELPEEARSGRTRPDGLSPSPEHNRIRASREPTNPGEPDQRPECGQCPHGKAPISENNSSDLRKHCAQGGTRTGLQPLQTLGTPGNIPNPNQSDRCMIRPKPKMWKLSTLLFCPISFGLLPRFRPDSMKPRLGWCPGSFHLLRYPQSPSGTRSATRAPGPASTTAWFARRHGRSRAPSHRSVQDP
ncbi:UNVERIFIED_ORG: hypothetical protein ABIB52_004616 [Arthrobacter sp. UYCu721]